MYCVAILSLFVSFRTVLFFFGSRYIIQVAFLIAATKQGDERLTVISEISKLKLYPTLSFCDFKCWNHYPGTTIFRI